MRDRPPFVLAFGADLQGCCFHRIMTPLASLVEAGVCDGRIDMALWPDDIALAAKPDVVVWQRQVEDAQVETMARWRKLLPDALFVYELDDYLESIPEASFHASFMPPDIEFRVTNAMVHCDRVTTSTEPLAEWLRSIGAFDVRVVPNALPQARLREREARLSGRLRVGFAGGMSHAGDLEILREAMAAIGDEVTWVFMGMQPKDPPVRVEFHPGVSVHTYLDGIMALDLDLMLAPLEDNSFNRCKSNLRLLEAGSVGACVIAQDLPPYHLDKPPVFAHASTPAEWTEAIRAFAKTKPAERKRNADALRSWVGRKYTLERRLQDRMAAWLPDTAWRPSPAKSGNERPVLACTDTGDSVDRMTFLNRMTYVPDGLEAACRKAVSLGTDVLWLRPTTVMTERGWASMRETAAMASEIASVVPLASDGSSGFPVADHWSPMPAATTELIDGLAAERFKGRRFCVAAPSGPVVLLTRNALSMLGLPDVAGCDGNEEQAILEWGARAAARQWKHMQTPDAFVSSMAPPAQPTQKAITRLQARGFAGWLSVKSEVLTPEERESLEIGLLRSQWGGPRPGIAGFDAKYGSWATLRAVQDKRSRRTDGPSMGMARFGDAKLANHAEWIVFVDDSITVSADALAWMADVARMNEKEGTDIRVVYADHETIVGEDRVPEFKPDFDEELFLAQDYVTPICAVRADVFGDDLPSDRSELYAVVLKIAKEYGPATFRHVPRVLAAMAVDMAPEKLAMETLARQVAIQELYGDDVEVEASRLIAGCLTVRRTWDSYSGGMPPSVTIVVPTLGSSRLIQPCVATILQHTRYPNYEILVVQNGDRQEPELTEATAADPHVRVVYYKGTSEHGFNWSRMNNWAIRRHVKSDYVLTLNDDVCVAAEIWLDSMMGQAVRQSVGAVGAKLVHPMGVIQHAGVVCHRGIAGHMHKGVPNGQAGHLGRAVLTHEASAATGACMLFSRANFDAVGGFREDMSHNYGDTAFCLALRKLGLKIVVEMSAELLHPEGTSRPSGMTPDGMKKLIEEGKIIAALCEGDDPYWSPNLALGFVQGGLAIQGLNAESLAWEDFRPRPGAERVLLVNDLPGEKGFVVNVLSAGDVPLCADLSGFRMRLTAPNAMNVRTWDVRNPDAMAKGLNALGIDRIVLRSLVGTTDAAPPVETLRTFRVLVDRGISVSVDSAHDMVAPPRDDTDYEEKARRTFGHVDTKAWQEAFDRLCASCAVEESQVQEAAQ